MGSVFRICVVGPIRVVLVLLARIRILRVVSRILLAVVVGRMVVLGVEIRLCFVVV